MSNSLQVALPMSANGLDPQSSCGHHASDISMSVAQQQATTMMRGQVQHATCGQTVQSLGYELGLTVPAAPHIFSAG